MQTLATPYRAASRQPSSSSARAERRAQQRMVDPLGDRVVGQDEAHGGSPLQLVSASSSIATTVDRN